MALLLSVDPDTDTDGLPDSWETQYYGHLGVDKNALAAGGGGLSNWQAFQQGTDPNDFYNGLTPYLLVTSGDGQRGAPGTTLQVPISVRVNSPGVYNAPLTFTVTSGTALLSNPDDGNAPSSAVNVRTITPVSASDLSQGYLAQVYVVLPPTGDSISTIAITAGSGSQSSTVNVTATASDPNLQPPMSFTGRMTSAVTADLSWTPSDYSLPTVVQQSYDGDTWFDLTQVNAGLSSTVINGLGPDTAYYFRLYTADAAGGVLQTNGGSPNATGAHGSSPCLFIPLIYLSLPIVMGEAFTVLDMDEGFGGLQDSSHLYTRCDYKYESSTPGSSSEYLADFHPEILASLRQGFGGIPHSGFTVQSDTVATRQYSTGTATITLSKTITVPLFLGYVEGYFPPFTNLLTPGVNNVSYLWQPDSDALPPDPLPDNSPLPQNHTHAYVRSKLQYEF